MESSPRDDLRRAVRLIITTIKPIDQESGEFADDAPLFSGDEGEVSPVEFDSLDMLDLAITIGDRFGFDQERLDRLIGGEVDMQSLRTVNDIVDFILSVERELAGESSAISEERIS